MNSPKDSNKFLVTYNSDESEKEQDEKLNEENNFLHEKLMDITPSTVNTNARDSKTNTPQNMKKKRKQKPKLSGLVSYGMDDEENSTGNTSDESESEASDQNNSNENGSVATDKDSQGLVKPDSDEHYDPQDHHESDMDVDSGNNGDDSKPVESCPDENLKKQCGISGLSQVTKANVLTERPQGTELAYLLSRQIYKTKAVELPQAPSTKASLEIEQKLQEIKNRIKSAPDSVLKILNNKEYRNPSIYEKLIQHLKIDERGTNYPPELYDPYRFNEESYYEHLAKAQEEAEKKRRTEKDNHDSKTKNDSQSRVSKPGNDSKIRLTKWDSNAKPSVVKSSSAVSLNNESKSNK